MKYLTLIVVLLITFVESAMASDTCRVYQYYANDSNQKRLVLTRAFNENGNVIYELVKRYIHYGDVGRRMEIDVMHDGQYFYSYKDGKLIRQVRLYPDYDADSTVIDYAYNRQGKLDSQVERWQSYPYTKIEGAEGLTLDTGKPKVWGQPTTSVYFYYPGNDSLFEERSFYKGKVTSTRHYYRYDNRGRAIFDSTTFNAKYSSVAYRWYGVDSVSRRILDVDYSAPFLFTYKLNIHGLVVRSYFFRYDKKNKKHVADSKIEYTYDERNRIVKSQFFVGKSLTTTHKFVYN